MRAVLLDGEVQHDGRVLLDAEDPGLSLGVGVFETLRTYGGRPFRPEAHHARLGKGLVVLALEAVSYEVFTSELNKAIHLVAAHSEGSTSRVQEALVRCAVTAGGARVVVARALPSQPASVRVVTRTWASPPGLASVKHSSRVHGVVERRRAGVDEVLWCDPQGHLLEGSWSNVMVVRAGVLLTPPADGRILPGVTRAALLEAAAEAGIPVEEGPTRLDGAEEVYLSSTLKELVPVVEIDGARHPGSGPVGRALRGAFDALVSRELGLSPRQRPRSSWG